MSKLINLIDKKFGRLIVLKRMDNDKRKHSRWLCRCSCNKKEIIVIGYNLTGGRTKSCGCLQKQRVTRHGHFVNSKTTKTHNSWHMMIQRCNNPNHKSYKYYGGREIKVCKRWMKFENFLEDMGEAPKGLQLDRIKNKKGYCKENCRWVTRTEQARNKQYNLYVTYNEENRLLILWSEKTGIPYKILYNRIYSCGWSIEKAFMTPVKKKRKK